MRDYYAEIGMRIKEKRISLDWSREILARMSGISDKFVYDIEAGKKGMSANTLHKISIALGVSADWLLDGKIK